MKRKNVIKKLQEELPEFNWKEDKFDDGSIRSIRTNIACAEITVGESYFCDDDVIEIPLQVMDRIVEHLRDQQNKEEGAILYKLFKEYDDGEILIEDIDENILDLIIKGLKLWKEGIDKLRKSDYEEDQLIIIHPDWSLEDFEKDFKFISSGNDCDHRLGIMSTKDWDFSNDELCQELNENSGDCFAIGQEEGNDYDDYDEDEDEEFKNENITGHFYYPNAIVDYDGLEKEYNELRSLYPKIEKITKIYCTDFD